MSLLLLPSTFLSSQFQLIPQYLHWLCAMPVLTNSSTGFFLSLILLTQSQHVSRTTRTPPSIDDRTTDGSDWTAAALELHLIQRVKLAKNALNQESRNVSKWNIAARKWNTYRFGSSSWIVEYIGKSCGLCFLAVFDWLSDGFGSATVDAADTTGISANELLANFRSIFSLFIYPADLSLFLKSY